MKIWRLAYRDEMVKMYKRIFKCKTHEECCQQPKLDQIGSNQIKLEQTRSNESYPVRWRWLRTYICD